MKFTIYTPFFNYLDTADDLFESVINQTYDNWEWLITDDFSDGNNVKDKLNEFQLRDSRIRVIESKWKKQYYYNIPVEHSTGDVMVKLDSDDIPSIKLLEVYKYNYEKFPDVISIGCSSLIKKGNHLGYVGGAKYINYKNSSNFLEAHRLGVVSVIGDARSYKIDGLKNNGVFVNEGENQFYIGEDIHKTLIVEEWGKFFIIPRILYNYTMRDDSDSGGLTVHSIYDEDTKREHSNFTNNIIRDARVRVDRESLFSIEKFYDSCFDHAKNFYFCELEDQRDGVNIEYWSNRLGIEDIDKLNDLYFDHNIFYNKVIDSPQYIVIDSVNDLGILKYVLSDRKIKDCIIVVTTSNEDRDKIGNQIKSLGYGYWFVIFYYSSFRIKV
jgi:glycosyltransferase involved in cell wall biosynthesis